MEKYAEAYKKTGSKIGVARELHKDEGSLRRFYRRHKEEIDGLIGKPETKSEPKQDAPSEPQIDIHQQTLSLLQKKERTIKDLETQLKTSPRIITAVIDDLKDRGFLIEEHNSLFSIRKEIELENTVYHEQWKGERIIRFGLCGDNQENSKYTQITHLHTFYDILMQEGISKCYHTGDIDEGEDMRQGHKYECYSQGADDHVKNIVKNYPLREGIETHFITGNHDWSILKKVGYDIGPAIVNERPDMKYLGQGGAVINLTPNCILELRHPGDGTAYAISYKPQKMIEAISGGEKPNILAIGHYHKAEYIVYRNVHCIQTGCFQAQTPWMKGKGIAAMMGGWIITVHVDEKGTITRFVNEFIPFYRAIKDDYLNWR